MEHDAYTETNQLVAERKVCITRKNDGKNITAQKTLFKWAYVDVFE